VKRAVSPAGWLWSNLLISLLREAFVIGSLFL
jgi:hypothetical protein